MTDTISQQHRSWNMSQIKSKNTTPEIIVRKYLHNRGLRFRLHRADLPGKPDIVLSKYHTVILIHGCFWHLHQNCKDAKIPKTNTEFWQKKLNKNVERDHIVHDSLQNLGWDIVVLWECQILNKSFIDIIDQHFNLNNKTRK
ncbi:MAG: very short patch repair endonuclease [Deferribacterales bacterium]